MTVTRLIKDCPVCGRQPDIDECGPWPPKGLGPAPWYANCYRDGKNEHCVGVNANDRPGVVRAWNVEVERRLALTGNDQKGGAA